MDETELDQLLAVLRNDDNPMACEAVLFLLSTGARLNEALSAEWRDIDRQSRVWE